MVVCEYWYIITQLLCVLGLAFHKHKGEENYTQWDYCLKAFRDIAFISDWTRVCFHGVFINLLDEMYLTSGSSAPSSPNTNAGPSGRREEEEGLVMVKTNAQVYDHLHRNDDGGAAMNGLD